MKINLAAADKIPGPGSMLVIAGILDPCEFVNLLDSWGSERCRSREEFIVKYLANQYGIPDAREKFNVLVLNGNPVPQLKKQNHSKVFVQREKEEIIECKNICEQCEHKMRNASGLNCEYISGGCCGNIKDKSVRFEGDLIHYQLYNNLISGKPCPAGKWPMITVRLTRGTKEVKAYGYGIEQKEPQPKIVKEKPKDLPTEVTEWLDGSPTKIEAK